MAQLSLVCSAFTTF